MSFSVLRCASLVMSLTTAAYALDGITVPSTVQADKSFQISFLNAGSDQYRVYLAAAVVGARGPSCYLKNSTDLSSPLDLTIPADIGPSADYYSIAISDLSTSQGPTYSPSFNFTGGTGEPSDYELHLGGAPFWNADSLPCSAITCVRECAQTSYPEDLTEDDAFDTMKSCIMKCPGVSPDDSQTEPARQNARIVTAEGAEITLASGFVVTAMETTLTSNDKTFTEALLGSKTLTLGDAAVTMSTHTVSLATNGVDVDSTTTVSFSEVAQIASGTVAASSSATGSSPSTSSDGAATRRELGAFGAAIAGLAAILL